MRKVMFKKWIPVKRNDVNGQVIEGTNCWEPEFSNSGLFHQWASQYEESSEGFGNYTVALVETQSGTIESVLPQNLKFVEPANF